MNQTKFNEHKEDFLKMARSLLKAKPFFHAVSGTTTALYIAIASLSFAFIQSMLESHNVLTIMLIAVTSIGIAFIAERLLSALLDGLGLAVATNASKRISIALSLVVIPLFSASLLTSFSAVKEGTVQASSKEGYISISDLTTRLSGNNNSEDNTNRIQIYANQRASMRKSLIEQYRTKKLHYDKDDLDNQQYLDNKLFEELEKFDRETERETSKKDKTYTDVEESGNNFNTKALEIQHEENQKIIGKYDYLGGLMGWIVAISLICSLVSSVLARWICVQAGVKVSQLMAKKPKGKTSGKG